MSLTGCRCGLQVGPTDLPNGVRRNATRIYKSRTRYSKNEDNRNISDNWSNRATLKKAARNGATSFVNANGDFFEHLT